MSVRNFILKNIENHPTDIIQITRQTCQVSRKTVYKHLDRLINDGLIYRKSRGKYFLSSPSENEYIFDVSEDLQEDVVWQKFFKEHFKDFSKNIYDTCLYGFTEILNNVIDHSEASKVNILFCRKDKNIIINITDNGIGIFKKIKNAFHLDDLRIALFQLTKGKLTTDPDNHTGEGIFFTSRAFDEFSILSGGLFYYKNVIDNDWYVESKDDCQGTSVQMEISSDSERILTEVFAQYTKGDDNTFNKTHILVPLAKLEEEKYVSRSQAKRILVNLEKFEYIVLDFKNVPTVGQAFVDEVFRVYKNKNPHTKFEYINANEDVEFMLKRSIPKE